MRARTGIVVSLVASAQLIAAAGASAAGPTPSGKLTLAGTLADGSAVTASGLKWTAAPGTFQSVMYSWSACTSTSCGVLSTPVHQPYLASVTLGPGDVGKKIRVQETATDVAPDGTPTSASVTYTSTSTVAPWPAGMPPRVDFIYGLPEAQTASTRELFQFSRPHANSANGTVTLSCALDDAAYSTACTASRRYLTPVLALGSHTMHVRATSRAGTTTTSYSWTVDALPAPVACSSCFRPPHLDATGRPMSWDWQLQGGLVFRTVDMFDIDGLDNSSSVVSRIHSRHGLTLPHEKAICYLSLGSWENFRFDESTWPKRALGLALVGYPQEHWVDVRQVSSLLPVIKARMQICAGNGFDGIEVDNIDGWQNPSGFPLTPEDAEAWLAAIANEAHSLNVFVLWKNDPLLASFGSRYFDGALSEQCYEYQECTTTQLDGTAVYPGLACNTTSYQCGVAQFAAIGKWVGEVEYKWGVPNEDGVVCDPGQTCTLRQSNGSYTEVPFTTFCSSVLRRFGFSAWRAYESDALDGSHSFYCRNSL